MATLLKSANFNGKNGTHFKLNLYYDYSQSIENNQTTIAYSLYMQSLDGYSGSGATSTGYINGTSVGTFSSIGKNTSILIGTKNAVVNHNNDGTFPSTAYSASIDTPWTLGDASVSGDLTGLPTIPRASSVSATNANIGSASTITITPKATGFTHTLKYKFAGQSSETTIVDKTSNLSVSFTIQKFFYSLIPNGREINGTIYCYTYKNNAQVGSATSYNIKGTAVFDDCKPKINSYSYSVDSTTSSLANNTTFIKNVTTASVTISAERREYSTLKSVGLYYVENNQIKTIVTQSINTTSGTFTLQLTPSQVRAGVWVGATDSRDYTHYEGTFPANVIPYVPLTADQSAQIARTNQTEAKVKITSFKGNYWNGSFRSGNANTLTIQWRYKESTASSWSSYYTIPASSITIANGQYTISNYILTDGTTTDLFDYQTAYNIQFIVTDKVGSKPANYTITAGVPNFAVFPSHVLFNGNYVNKLQADLAFGEKNYGFTENDWNNAPGQKGKYMGSGKSNSPLARTISNWWYVDQHLHLSNYRKQIAYAFSQENNNIYIRDESYGNWTNWDAVKTETTMHYNPDIPTTGVWTRVCRVNFYQHVQGEFCYLRIYISPGQNGRDNQNAYIDLVMQLGYTGDNGGRAGCNAELHAFNSVYTLSNTNIKVIAGSNTDYYVWVYTSYAYNRVNYTANSGVNCNIWDAFTTQSAEPTGTACNLEYRNNGMAVGSVGTDHYIKYDSGIMECFGTFGGTYNITNAYGSGFYYSMPNHSFAQAFKWAPQLNVTIYSATGLFSYSINSITTSEFKGFIWTCNSASNQACQIHYHATGYWK